MIEPEVFILYAGIRRELRRRLSFGIQQTLRHAWEHFFASTHLKEGHTRDVNQLRNASVTAVLMEVAQGRTPKRPMSGAEDPQEGLPRPFRVDIVKLPVQVLESIPEESDEEVSRALSHCPKLPEILVGIVLLVVLVPVLSVDTERLIVIGECKLQGCSNWRLSCPEKLPHCLLHRGFNQGVIMVADNCYHTPPLGVPLQEPPQNFE